MKKLFAIMLSVLMLMSCMTLLASAENDRVIITDCSTTDGWKGETGSGIPDPEINTELDPDGYGVVAFTYTGQLYNEGGWNHPNGNGTKPTNGVKIHYAVAETEAEVEQYDLTGMKYLIFDLYVSNPELVKDVNFWLELTSSGKPDKEERNWKQPLSGYVGGEVVAGWNHIELDITKTSSDSGFNPANWNFMRMFNSQGFDAGEGFTLAFKNIYFSATSPQAEAAAAAAAALIEKYQVIADIKAGSITADNYETVKAQLAAATEAYNAAELATQTAAEEALDLAKIERTVTRALEKYENELAAAEQQPETPPADEPTTPPADEPTTPPADEPETPPTTEEPTTPPAEDPTTPPTEEPTEPAPEKSNSGLIIVIAAVVVVVAAIVIVMLAKKKKK